MQDAKSRGKEVVAQHIAAEILVCNSETAETLLKIKEHQKELYFLSLERKRKLGVVKKLKEELEEKKKKELLKKQIEEKIKKVGLAAALESLELTKTKVLAKDPKKSSLKHTLNALSSTGDNRELEEIEGEEEVEEEGDEEEDDEDEDAGDWKEGDYVEPSSHYGSKK